ncbi:MAG: GerAB/ArcD/ProY family transporter [Clostridia bacterium]|nr:GerAB/ArcD/ProY family transporter [Clostridia bacterium]
MNLREGRVGNGECVFTLVISLCMSGLFVFESIDAYTHGNSTYISLPIACILAFSVFAVGIFAMTRSRSSDLCAMCSYALGKTGAAVVCVFIIVIILACISTLLNKFLNVMYSYFFQDASYYSLAAFFLAVLVVFSCMGFETVNRAAKVLGVVFLATHILLLVNSFSSYETYKIYPIAGDGMKSMLRFAFESGILFLPGFVSALITAKGMHGTHNTSRIAVKALIFTVIICTVTQLLLALSYPYDDIAKLYMPLYRMSMVTGEENFLVRLDKISAFIWVAAALLACSYYIYSASLLYCRSFRQVDIRPASCSLSVIVIMLCLLSHSEKRGAFSWLNFVGDYGTLLLAVPIIAVSVIAIIKSCIQRSSLGEVGHANI